MPSFGSLLKKKRTKDKDGPASPTSPIEKTFSNNTLTKTVSSRSDVQTSTSPPTTSSAVHSTVSHEKADEPMTSPPASANNAGGPVNETKQATIPPGSDAPIATGFASATPPPNAKAIGIHQMADGTWPIFRDAKATKGKYTLTDFQMQRTLGTGSFGRVHLAQSKHNQRYYAIKVLKKAQVVKMKQIEHTNDERRMLAEVKHPFLITLWGTFNDSKNLYMVMDFVEGGELFSLLRKSQVRRSQYPMALTRRSLMRGIAISQSCGQILRR